MSSIEVGSNREEAILGHSKLSQLPLWSNISLLKLTLDGTRNLLVREGGEERGRERERGRGGERERERRGRRERGRGGERGRERREREGEKVYAHVQISTCTSKGENSDIFSRV